MLQYQRRHRFRRYGDVTDEVSDMKKGILVGLCVLVLVLVTACRGGNAGPETGTTTTTTASTCTTTVTPAPTTGKPTTTVTTTKPTVTTTTRDINVMPSATKTPQQRYILYGTPVFSYESEDYDVLRKVILQKFPGEKDLDEFYVTKTKKNYTVFDGAEYVQSQYNVIFSRRINGCATHASYYFFFDENDKCIALRGRQEEYDPTKVVPPRVATEEEIEAAKKEEAKKVPEGCVVWKQEASRSIYDIERDANYFTIDTVYASKQSYELYLAGTFREPPHSMYSGVYVIPR